MRARLTLPVLLLIAGVPAVMPASAAEDPNEATWTQVWFPSSDGTMLRADLMLPATRREGDRHPVILSIGPYFGRNPLNGGGARIAGQVPTPGEGPVNRFSDLVEGGRIFERGYAYIQVDSRGYGGSDGCNDFGGHGEQMDAEAAVNWAATQPWSNGKVGMWGKSYDAWTQVMALAENPVGLAAAVIQAPLISAYDALFMNGVHYNSGWYATPGLYGGYDLAPAYSNDVLPEEILYPAKGTATNPACYAQNLAMTPIPERSLPYWRERDIADLAARSRVPVMWSHGFFDANTKPNNFLPVYERLQGPKRAWVGQWAHVRGNEVQQVGRDGFLAEAMDWFDHYLKDMALVQHPGAEVQSNEGTWRAEESWPPADARPFAMPIRAGSYDDAVGNSVAGSTGGRGTWTLTPPAPHDMHVSGTAALTATVTTQAPGANLIAMLYDIDEDGVGILMTRGAYRIEQPGTSTIAFDLYPQDWIIRAGHRLGVSLAGADGDWFQPTWTQTKVSVEGGSLEVPFLRYERTPNLAGGRGRSITFNVMRVPAATIAERTEPTEFPPPLEQR